MKQLNKKLEKPNNFTISRNTAELKLVKFIGSQHCVWVNDDTVHIFVTWIIETFGFMKTSIVESTIHCNSVQWFKQMKLTKHHN